MDDRRRTLLDLLRPHDLRGADLRFSLLTLLHQSGRPCSIPELLDQLQSRGLVVGGRNPAKMVSDALRHEVRRGRVRRIQRGWYEGLPRPDTTTRRHRDRLSDLVEKAASHRAAPPP